jgi:hypothetical protein
MTNLAIIAVFWLASALIGAGAGQTHQLLGQPRPDQADSAKVTAPSPAGGQDISGMYTFLKEGEFVQINVDRESVTGYVSRWGDLESDRGTFLDQFFTKAMVQGHDVGFTTKPVHGVWFEFKGRFDRGQAKTRSEDGYYVLRGTLTEFMTDSDKKATSRSREVEFRLMAQPQDDEDKDPKSGQKPKKKS